MKARSYLEYTAFSKVGLIHQLTYPGEGFSQADAEWAVSQLTVDWNEQAYKRAQSYLEYTSFSRKSLITQLTYSGEGFTKAEATYAVDKVGL